MYKRIIIISFFSFFILKTFSQEVISTYTVDRDTYRQWQEKDWKGLIKTGKNALIRDIDFFYLRYRLGIAYFGKKNYHMAISHFEKAVAVNSDDNTLKEYLYYSYLYAGREEEAEDIKNSFSDDLLNSLKLDSNKTVKTIGFSYNYAFIEDESAGRNFLNETDITEPGFQSVFLNHSLININLSHHVARRLYFNHSFTNISQTSLHLKIRDSLNTTDPDYKTTIKQYYLSGNYQPVKNMNIILGLHYLYLRFPSESTGFGPRRMALSVPSDNDFSGSFSLNYDFKYFSSGAGINFSFLNGGNQTQGDIFLSYYPLGNMNIYSSSVISYQQEIQNDNTAARTVLSQSVGVKIVHFLWTEAYADFGELHNFVQNNGQTIFNNLEIIKDRFGGRIILPFRRFKINLNYSYYTLTSSFYPANAYHEPYNNFKSNNHSITGGIIWKF